MKIIIGSDHKGHGLKSRIIEHFNFFEWIDVGTDSVQRTDYPVYAKKVCKGILAGEAELGVLVCGSGAGMTIAANRFAKIYAAVCWNKDVSVSAKADDGINVLVLPSDFVKNDLAFEIIKKWLNTKFKEGRYKERLDMMDE